jgi:hypothetical protein
VEEGSAGTARPRRQDRELLRRNVPRRGAFLTDHDVRYVVWSVRESKDIDAWKSIMQAIDADYRWMEFSTAPEAPIGLWIRR